ncbi:MAG: hypothetical protein IKW58_00200 [Alphaproteobacteria bacterium]|nr:hypothetical protein [Alphaproteobacteria bacterium]
MKFSKILVLSLVLFATNTKATASYIEDVRSLGYVAGEGLACGAKRYPAYELISRAFLVSSASSDEEQYEGMYEYNSAKAEAYISKRQDGLLGCSNINKRFNSQKIFNSKLYKNGTIKLPDGKIIKPRQKYNPNYLYDKTKDERSALNAYYDKIMTQRQQKAQREGIYQKIKQEEAKRRR